jgi:hypothetical protein
MIKQKSISKYTSTEFGFDIKRWKSLAKHIENELVFIDRLIKSEAFDNRTFNLTERLQTFGRQILIIAQALKDFEFEIIEYEKGLANLISYETATTDNFWLDQHNALKRRFEIFCQDFNAFRVKVLQYTGGVL